jgi:hypothetical protein
MPNLSLRNIKTIDLLKAVRLHLPQICSGDLTNANLVTDFINEGIRRLDNKRSEEAKK